jgi:asparagine N-glycosylation enzyme membrane subunit Stt3
VFTTAQPPDRDCRTLSVWQVSQAFHPTAWTRGDPTHQKGETPMLYTLAVILLIAWLLGVIGTYTIGAFVHVLLVVALVLFLVGLLSRRRTVV